MVIRVDCYLARLDQFKKKYPPNKGFHFEVITRSAKSPLSPSKELLTLCKANVKDWPFPKYAQALLREFQKNPKALNLLRKLRNICESKMLFLVCFEKDPQKCHRSVVREILRQMPLLIDEKGIIEIIDAISKQKYG